MTASGAARTALGLRGIKQNRKGAEYVPDAVGNRARHFVVRERWLCRARAFAGGPTGSKRKVQPVGLCHPNAGRGAALVDARARLPRYGMPRDTDQRRTPRSLRRGYYRRGAEETWPRLQGARARCGRTIGCACRASACVCMWCQCVVSVRGAHQSHLVRIE